MAIHDSFDPSDVIASAPNSARNRPDSRSSLPGEKEVDGKLLWHAIDQVNEISSDRGLDASLHIGQFLLEAFFEGNKRLYRKRGRNHATYRALLDHSALRLSGASLWYAVAVKEQYDAMPKAIAEALSLSHHRVLLPVRSTSAKVKLAQQAIANKLSKRQLESLRRKVCLGEWQRGRGRPRVPELQKAIRDLRSSMEHMGNAERQPATMSTEDIIETLESLEAMQQKLTAAHDRLSEHLGPIMGPPGPAK